MSHRNPRLIVMNKTLLSANSAFIAEEIAWFRQILELRFAIHSGEQPAVDPLDRLPAPDVPEADAAHPAPYPEVIRNFRLGPPERLVLVLSYLPHIRPDVLDP